MPYIEPSTVVSPKNALELNHVLFSTGRGNGEREGWSACECNWYGEPSIGIRWNGVDSETAPGNPQSRGHPTWFILPKELEAAILAAINQIRQVRERITVRATKPEGWAQGAWQVEIKLSELSADREFEIEKLFPLPSATVGICVLQPQHTEIFHNGTSWEKWAKLDNGSCTLEFYVQAEDRTKWDKSHVEDIFRALLDTYGRDSPIP